MKLAACAMSVLISCTPNKAYAGNDAFLFFTPYLMLCTLEEPERYARTAQEIDFYDGLVKSLKPVDIACLQREKPASRTMCDALKNPQLMKDPEAPETYFVEHFEDIRRASVFSGCGWPRLWTDPKFDTPLEMPITPR